MALDNCRECGASAMGEATTCPDCGIDLPGPKRFEWRLWVPIGFLMAMLAYSLSVPQGETDAQAARQLCKERVAGGVAKPSECDAVP